MIGHQPICEGSALMEQGLVAMTMSLVSGSGQSPSGFPGERDDAVCGGIICNSPILTGTCQPCWICDYIFSI